MYKPKEFFWIKRDWKQSNCLILPSYLTDVEIKDWGGEITF